MNTTTADSMILSKAGARYFYLGAALLLLILTFLGFKLFYLHGQAFPGRPLTPPIRGVLIAHGVSMTLWVLLMVLQPLLIVSGQRSVHRLIGKIGAVLAAAIVVFGLQLSIGAAKVNPPDLKLWGLAPHAFLAIPLCALVLFAGFVAVGVWKRGKPVVHRAMMLLGTLAASAAAIDRIPAIQTLFANTLWGAVFGPFFPPVFIGAIFLAIKSILRRPFNRAFAVGYAVIVIAGALTMAIAKTPQWTSAMDAFLR